MTKAQELHATRAMAFAHIMNTRHDLSGYDRWHLAMQAVVKVMM